MGGWTGGEITRPLIAAKVGNSSAPVYSCSPQICFITIESIRAASRRAEAVLWARSSADAEADAGTPGAGSDAEDYRACNWELWRRAATLSYWKWWLTAAVKRIDNLLSRMMWIAGTFSYLQKVRCHGRAQMLTHHSIHFRSDRRAFLLRQLLNFFKFFFFGIQINIPILNINSSFLLLISWSLVANIK